jgi:hypothetical protein
MATVCPVVARSQIYKKYCKLARACQARGHNLLIETIKSFLPWGSFELLNAEILTAENQLLSGS